MPKKLDKSRMPRSAPDSHHQKAVPRIACCASDDLVQKKSISAARYILGRTDPMAYALSEQNEAAFALLTICTESLVQP
jgi:hypothetical protein